MSRGTPPDSSWILAMASVANGFSTPHPSNRNSTIAAVSSAVITCITSGATIRGSKCLIAAFQQAVAQFELAGDQNLHQFLRIGLVVQQRTHQFQRVEIQPLPLINEDQGRLSGFVTGPQKLFDSIHLLALGSLRADVEVRRNHLQEFKGSLELASVGKIGDAAFLVRSVAGGQIPEQGRLAHSVAAQDAAQALFAGDGTPEADDRFLQRRVRYMHVGLGEIEKTGTSMYVL